jgi:hypothetical protein
MILWLASDQLRLTNLPLKNRRALRGQTIVFLSSFPLPPLQFEVFFNSVQIGHLHKVDD